MGFHEFFNLLIAMSLTYNQVRDQQKLIFEIINRIYNISCSCCTLYESCYPSICSQLFNFCHKLFACDTFYILYNLILEEFHKTPYSNAAAPEIISISSLVMTACLVRLKVSVSLSIISPAFLLALSIAVILLDCSLQAPSFIA